MPNGCFQKNNENVFVQPSRRISFVYIAFVSVMASGFGHIAHICGVCLCVCVCRCTMFEFMTFKSPETFASQDYKFVWPPWPFTRIKVQNGFCKDHSTLTLKECIRHLRHNTRTNVYRIYTKHIYIYARTLRWFMNSHNVTISSFCPSRVQIRFLTTINMPALNEFN